MKSIVGHIAHGNKLQWIIVTVTICLLLLWIPVALDKLSNFTAFKASMKQQPLPGWLSSALIYLLPVAELITALLLVFGKTRKFGFSMSLVLMLIFTGYVGLALLGAWGNLPCSCGAVISGMGWRLHFLFNCSFLILSAYGVYLLKKQGAYHQ